MNEVVDFFRKLFDTSDWPPRWYCGTWSSFHGWLYIISNLLIWSAYFALPLIILRYISRKSDSRFVRAYFLFAAFILACGSTHLLDAAAFWFPAYRLNALVLFITGIISWITVIYSFKILPVAMSLKTHAQLEKEIVERKKAEDELLILNAQLNEAQDIAKTGHWQWDVAENKLTWSGSLFKIYGFTPGKQLLTYDDFINRVFPDDRNFVNDIIKEAFLSKKFPEYVHRIILDDGTVKVLQAKGEVITNAQDEVVRMIGTGQDITEHHMAQQQLLNKTHELEAANIELQKFAYIASHDLQEPLRKILTFASLLENESGSNSSERSKVYMEKIVHSAVRMQRLIDDVLKFSNVKNSVDGFVATDLNAVLEQVLSDMEVRIEECDTQLKKSILPVIEAVPSQMGQLFQNLISNAIKFKKDDQPAYVEITSKVMGGQELIDDKTYDSYIKNLSMNHRIWANENFVRIQVKDKGIGFDAEYSEKIFEIFQRLNSLRTYSGTGIGLAICKKIVDNHHGLIQAYSHPNNGSVFTFLLPVSQKHFQK